MYDAWHMAQLDAAAGYQSMFRWVAKMFKVSKKAYDGRVTYSIK